MSKGQASTVWPLDAHSRGKHQLLQAYLEAWFPILGASFSRVVFVDGFAGPGRYAGGEDGSPLISLKTFLRSQVRDKPASFFFIEENAARVERLRRTLAELEPMVPPSVRWEVVPGRFDASVPEVLKHVRPASQQAAPSFVMADPFGVSHTPMSVLQEILRNERAEVYVSFMWGWLNRFKTHPEMGPHLDGLFGCSTWREAIEIQETAQRRRFVYSLYERQLRLAGAKYVLHFDLYRERQLVYSIFFATKSPLGADKMKQAIWKIAPLGDFAYRGSRSPQLDLGLSTVDFRPLRNALLDAFRGGPAVSVEDVAAFVLESTDFHSGQYKGLLAEMEREGVLQVADAPRNRKRGSFPGGTKMFFVRGLFG